MNNQKTLFWVAVVFVLALAAFVGLNHFIYSEKQADEPAAPVRLTLEGTFVCLPHRDTSGPQTDECASGMHVADGVYYAVDLSLMSQENPNLAVGDRFRANGLFTPIEYISSDHWQIYDIEGIFSITDSVEKLQ